MSTTIESSWENERLKEEIESLRQQLSERTEMTAQDAFDEWMAHDEWQFADREACWKFMFEKGQESMRLQLASCQAALADTEALEIGTGERLAKVEQQLAAALAACKAKDEALEGLIDTMDLRLDDDDLSLETRTAFEALATQPDDSALKAWIGEPVGEVKRHTGSLKDMAIIVWAGQQPEEGTKLYSPKGLK